MALIRKLFWVVLFIVFTFSFVVLFDHGTTDFFKHMKEEFDFIKKNVGWKPEPKKDESDKIGN